MTDQTTEPEDTTITPSEGAAATPVEESRSPDTGDISSQNAGDESARDESARNASARDESDPGTGGRAERKVRLGVVVSNKMQKTVVVQVQRSIRHPLYGRTVNRRKRYKVHDEQNQCQVGDRVEIRETRPLSKDKRWRVSQIVERAR